MSYLVDILPRYFRIESIRWIPSSNLSLPLWWEVWEKNSEEGRNKKESAKLGQYRKFYLPLRAPLSPLLNPGKQSREGDN